MAASFTGLSLLWGCTPLATSSAPSSTELKTLTPPAWVAPLPHGGNLQNLTQWWKDLGDPVLTQLVEAAQSVSPGLASATSRLAQSRAALTSAQAANRPTLDASLSAQRGVNASSPTVGTGLQSNLGASWEIDLFGANRNSASAADARLQGAQAQWHEARVSVAAETATRYWGWHHCTATLQLVKADSLSRQQTARLTDLSAKAGFAAPSSAGLAQASAAEGNARVVQQQTACDSQVKGLVALTGYPEAELARLLARAPAQLPAATQAPIDTVPARVLAQRPDLVAAEREVAAASADLGAAQAQRYPRLLLGGSIGTLNYTNASGTTDLSTWSIGPVSLSLPIFDGGRRAANTEAAQARYTEATALYQARARQAVREVEETLLTLHSVSARQQDANSAALGYRQYFEAIEHRLRAGSASVAELEDARRTTLAAQMALAQLAQERSNAWVSLYRALGGGWNLADTANEPSSASNTSQAAAQ